MNTKNSIIMIIIAVVVGGAAFYGGMKYQQSKVPSFTANANTRFGNAAGGVRGTGQGGGRFTGANGERPVNGEIIAQDDKSITVKMMDGSTKIVILSENTAINKSAAGSKTDLTQGQRVLVIGKTNSDGSVTAQNIQLNPQMRIMGNGTAPSATPTAK